MFFNCSTSNPLGPQRICCFFNNMVPFVPLSPLPLSPLSPLSFRLTFCISANHLQCLWRLPQVVACTSDADWMTKEEFLHLLRLLKYHRGKGVSFNICDDRFPSGANLKLHLRIPSYPGTVDVGL